MFARACACAQGRFAHFVGAQRRLCGACRGSNTPVKPTVKVVPIPEPVLKRLRSTILACVDTSWHQRLAAFTGIRVCKRRSYQLQPHLALGKLVVHHLGSIFP